MKSIPATFVLLFALAGCADESDSSSTEPRTVEQNPDTEISTQVHEPTLDLTMAGVELTMTVFSCNGAGSQFQPFELAAAVDPAESNRNYVGLTVFEMSEVADRPLSRNVLVTINLANATNTQRDVWTSNTIDNYQHEGDTVEVTGGAVGQRHRFNADGTQVLEAPAAVDDGAPRPFRITARCP